jgi:hypothetical protein
MQYRDQILFNHRRTSHRRAWLLVLCVTLALAVGYLVAVHRQAHPATQTVRITDPGVAQSPELTKFVTDLYTGSRGGYWRDRPQSALAAQAEIWCSDHNNADLRQEFPGLSPAGILEFTKAAQREVCGMRSS